MARNAIPAAPQNLLRPLLGTRKRPLLAKTVALPHVILLQLTHRSNILVVFVGNSCTCIEKALVCGTPNRVKHSNFSSPTSTAITNSSGLLESTGHLGAVTKTTPPLLEEQAKISLQEFGSFENAHHVFQNEQWIKAGMRDHPTIKVCISMDNSWCYTRGAPIVARNQIAKLFSSWLKPQRTYFCIRPCRCKPFGHQN